MITLPLLPNGDQGNAQTVSVIVIVDSLGFVIIDQLEPLKLLLVPSTVDFEYKLNPLLLVSNGHRLTGSQITVFTDFS